MATLSLGRIAELLIPYGVVPDDGLLERLSAYLDLLMKWNERTNLTAIRRPEEIVSRHFGESLFAARYVGECATLLDFGSGAGFPGLPVAMVRGEMQVTLAESQHKKAAFLREAVRVLDLGVEVWGDRVEAMPMGRRFDCVAMRAVDGMERALELGARVADREMVLLTTGAVFMGRVGGFSLAEEIRLPGSQDGLAVRLLRN